MKCELRLVVKWKNKHQMKFWNLFSKWIKSAVFSFITPGRANTVAFAFPPVQVPINIFDIKNNRFAWNSFLRTRVSAKCLWHFRLALEKPNRNFSFFFLIFYFKNNPRKEKRKTKKEEIKVQTKKILEQSSRIIFVWCEWWDLNPHSFEHAP